MHKITQQLTTNMGFVLLFVCYQLGLLCVVNADPFFGDAISSTAQAANHIYSQQLLTIFYPPQIDPGHPTLYSWLLALCWQIFGKTLLVAHAFSCVWAFVFILSFKKLASIFLPPLQTLLACLCLLFFATYLSQSAMMLNTMALMSFFLLAIHGVYTSNNKQTMLFASLMGITHLQAPFLLLSLAGLSFSLYGKTQFFVWFKNQFLVFAVPFLVFVTWLFIHYNYTGWLFVSPNYSDADDLNGLLLFVKALAVIVWRLVDYGMITTYAVIAWFYIKHKKARPIINQWLWLIMPCAIAMAVFLNNTIGHRYFMAFSAVAFIVLMQLCHLYLTIQKQRIVMAVVLASLLAGNFLYYPGKNLGDATLAYRGCFKAMQALRSEHDTTIKLYSHSPIANPTELTHLQTIYPEVYRIEEENLDSYPAIIQSNVNAEFSVAQQQYLAQNWYGKTYEHGAVYVNVFLNPRFHPKPQNWVLRNPSGIEKLILDFKQRAGK